jgi:uncharacterized membrane protein YbaN (DUF454 family)
MKVSESKIVRIFLIITGSIFVGIGILGIFLPLLPSTVFFIIAAACYVRSSEKFYEWLLTNKLFGNQLKNYLEHKSMPKRAKIIAITMMWATISFSAYIVPLLYVRLLLLIIAIGVTTYILSLKTLAE